MSMRRWIIVASCLAWMPMASAHEQPCIYAGMLVRAFNDDPGFILEKEPGIDRLWTLRRTPALAGPKAIQLRAEAWSEGQGWSLLGFPPGRSLHEQMKGVEVIDGDGTCPFDRRLRVQYEVGRVDARTCPAALTAARQLGEVVKSGMDRQLGMSHWLGEPAPRNDGLDRIVLDGHGYQLKFEGSTLSLAYGRGDAVLAQASDRLIDAVTACAARGQPVIKETSLI